MNGLYEPRMRVTGYWPQ